MTEKELMEKHPPFRRCLTGEPTAADRQWLRFLDDYLKDWDPPRARDPLCGLVALTGRLTDGLD